MKFTRRQLFGTGLVAGAAVVGGTWVRRAYQAKRAALLMRALTR